MTAAPHRDPGHGMRVLGILLMVGAAAALLWALAFFFYFIDVIREGPMMILFALLLPALIPIQYGAPVAIVAGLVLYLVGRRKARG